MYAWEKPDEEGREMYKYYGLYCVDAAPINFNVGKKKLAPLTQHAKANFRDQFKSPLNRQTNDLFEAKITRDNTRKDQEELTDEFNYGFDSLTLPIYNMTIKRLITAREISGEFPYYKPKGELPTKLNDGIPLEFGGFSPPLNPYFDPSNFGIDLDGCSFGEYLFMKMVNNQIEQQVSSELQQQYCDYYTQELDDQLGPQDDPDFLVDIKQEKQDRQRKNRNAPLLLHQFITSEAPNIPEVRAVTNEFNRRYDEQLRQSLLIYKKNYRMKDRDEVDETKRLKVLQMYHFYSRALRTEEQIESQSERKKQYQVQEETEDLNERLELLEVSKGRFMEKRVKQHPAEYCQIKRYRSSYGEAVKREKRQASMMKDQARQTYIPDDLFDGILEEAAEKKRYRHKNKKERQEKKERKEREKKKTHRK